MNPYKILELEKNCTDQQIRSAYKKMALKYHPDRNINNKEEATEKFKDIATAYEILINKKKRNLYDLTGNINSNHNINPFQVFEVFF